MKKNKNFISGNLEYDLAIVIERYEDKEQIAKSLIDMLNQKMSSAQRIQIYIGMLEALFQTVIDLRQDNQKLKDALTHPIILDALKADKNKKKS